MACLVIPEHQVRVGPPDLQVYQDPKEMLAFLGSLDFLGLLDQKGTWEKWDFLGHRVTKVFLDSQGALDHQDLQDLVVLKVTKVNQDLQALDHLACLDKRVNLGQVVFLALLEVKEKQEALGYQDYQVFQGQKAIQVPQDFQVLQVFRDLKDLMDLQGTLGLQAHQDQGEILVVLGHQDLQVKKVSLVKMEFPGLLV